LPCGVGLVSGRFIQTTAVMKTVTVITPAYNEAPVIAAFYAEVKRVLSSLADRYESRILFVVERSEDDTLAIVKQIAAADQAVTVLALSSRFGQQNALLAGIDACDSDAVIMMDSDLQHPPALIPEMLALFEGGYDVVYTVRQDTPEIGWFKRTSSTLFYRLLNRMSDVPIIDGAADFRLVSRRVADVFRTQIRERNLFFRGMMGWIGFKSVALPFRARPRQAGHSKYSVSRMIRFGLDGVISFSKSPLHAAIVAGLVFAALGFGVALFAVAQSFTHASLSKGWATLTVLVSILSGIQLIFLGVIGAYIGAILDEVKARPHYIVDERINAGDQGAAHDGSVSE